MYNFLTELPWILGCLIYGNPLVCCIFLQPTINLLLRFYCRFSPLFGILDLFQVRASVYIIYLHYFVLSLDPPDDCPE